MKSKLGCFALVALAFSCPDLARGQEPTPAPPEAPDAKFDAALADEGKLALAGPFDGVDGWRGLFIFAVADLEEARKLVATDPVVASGEMVPELHEYYGSAALMLVNEAHERVQKKSF